MSPTVTNEPIDRLIEAARGAGATAGKVCGAGGGGCVILWARPEKRQAVAEEAARLGARVLDFHIVTKGVEVSET